MLLLVLCLGDAFLTSVACLDTVADINGVGRWRRLDQQHSASLDLTALGLQREERSAYPPPYSHGLNNDQLITKHPVFDAYSPAKNNYHLVIARDPRLKRMALGSERIWFAREIAQVALNEKNFDAYRSRAEILNGFPVVVHTQSEMLKPGQAGDSQPDEADRISELPAAETTGIKLLRYLPEELTFEVECPADGWLLVTDRWARSWRCEINGNPVTVYGGNFIFRAVPVSAGKSQVRFTYRPLAFPWLDLLSWGLLAGVLAGSVYRRVKREREKPK
jgi:hypothetical protein